MRQCRMTGYNPKTSGPPRRSGGTYIETRELVTHGGVHHLFQMKRAHWEMYDDLLVGKWSHQRIMEAVADEHSRDPSHGLSEWLAGVVVFISEAELDTKQTIQDFARFCAAQPRTPEGMRKIKEEGARLKAEHPMLWGSK